jgi:4-carboxymuconolactone decarboxylase
VPRLPIITEEQLTPAQRHVWTIVTQGARGSAHELVDSSGGLIGPFNAMLTAPQMGAHLASLGETLRFGSTLEPRVIELTTLVVGARWRSNFEWAAHRPLAQRAGIDDLAIAAIASRQKPAFEDPTLADVYDFVDQLLAQGAPELETYHRLHPRFGDVGMVELVALVGYYSLICFSLNTFETELPHGESAQWTTSSR